MHGAVSTNFTSVRTLCVGKNLAHGAKLHIEVDRATWVAHLSLEQGESLKAGGILLFI